METGGSFGKDERFCKRVIGKIRTKFVEDLNPVSLVDVFLEEEYITNIQARDIQELVLTSEKNRSILDTVSTKGVNGYSVFKRCLRKSRQEHLAEYLDKLEAQLQQTDGADEESGKNQDKGFKCFACNISCDNLQVLEKHTKTAQHLDMLAQQKSFAEKFTEETIEEDGDLSFPGSISVPNSYSDHCYLCIISFTSAAHASSHFSGKRHQKKQAQFDAEMQESAVCFNTDIFKSNELPTEGALEQANSRYTLSIETTDSVSSQLTHNKPKIGLNCDICKVPFTGPENAKQHYDSERHKKKVLLMQKKQDGDVLPLACASCNCTFTGQESAEAHFKSEKHKKKITKESESAFHVTSASHVTPASNVAPASYVTSSGQSKSQFTDHRGTAALSCEICDVTLTGPENAVQHYNGAKHKKKELLIQKQKQGEILPLSCDLCQCLSFSGQEIAEAHFSSARHQKKKRDSGENCLPLSCTVCCCSFTGQENAKEHFESMKHKQKEESMKSLLERSNDLDRSFRGSGEGQQASYTTTDENNLSAYSITQEDIEDPVASDLERLSLDEK